MKPSKRVCDWTKIEYDCTLSYMAHQIGIKLWQAMVMMKYAKKKNKEVRGA